MKNSQLKEPWTIWITGLSGSGKTTICKELLKILKQNSIRFDYLRLDEIRQFITPNPTFSVEEREINYRTSVYVAESLNRHNINAIIDSVDGEGTGRRLGKERIPLFKVIRVDCPLEVCIEREKNRTDKAQIIDIYQKALQGQLTLAGMGKEYCLEEDPFLIIDSTRLSALEAAKFIAKSLI